MRPSALLLALVAGGSLTLGALDAFGHAHLTQPMRRDNCQGGDDSSCKPPAAGPCGGTPNPAFTPTIYYVGDTVTIEWDETIDHVSTYRVAISTNGDGNAADFDAWVISPHGTVPDDAGGGLFSFNWTVPDTQNCQPCVMQLIQDMDNDPGTLADPYYNCADIQILQAGQTPAPTPTPPTPTPTPNSGDPIEIDGYGGCSIAAMRALPAGLLAPAALLAFALLRRRRTR